MSASSVDIPADYAQWLFENGATLVFLDLPTGSEFGIDYNCYEVGPQFKGVKMIPPGIHFIYYRYLRYGYMVHKHVSDKYCYPYYMGMFAKLIMLCCPSVIEHEGIFTVNTLLIGHIG